MKIHFPILDCMPRYPYPVQVRIVLACCVLHNLIKIKSGEDEFYEEYALKERILDRLAQPEMEQTWEAPSTQDKEVSGAERMQLSEKMYDDYITVPVARQYL